MKPITIVAGFGRCGSSLVMQMLAAGGMPTPYSEYPSYEVQNGTQLLIAKLYGAAIKTLDPHINRPPPGLPYRFIWIDRDPVEQAKSMVKFVGAVSNVKLKGDAVATLAASFKKDRPKANAVMLHYAKCHQILKLKFEEILADPAGTAKKLHDFCGGKLDEAAMAAAVRPRGPECLPYLMEFEQMAEVEKQNG